MVRTLSLLLLLSFAIPIHAAEPETKPKVKLVVLLVFDQMRGDYISRWQPLFVEDGFKRLQTSGAWFTDCNYPYSITTTGPGHASIFSGCGPRQHGIANNDWYDRASGKTVYCAGSSRYQFVPNTKDEDQDVKDKETPATVVTTNVGNPDRMLSPTVGDVNKAAGGRVFGLSLKDRSALLPAGKKPDGAYWFAGGKFVTSTYYRDTPHTWVAEFNKSDAAKSYFDKQWAKFRPDLDYTQLTGSKDDGVGEGTGVSQGKSFPHSMTGGAKEPSGNYYKALATSPFGNELLVNFAKKCIDVEKLGSLDKPDVLTISFSSNDLIGHAFGPDSHEVLDVTLRSDVLVADLLKYLDTKVGAGKYAVIVTADHGVCPLPEKSAKEGKDAKRVQVVQLIAAAEIHLREKYGEPPVDEKTKKASRWIEATPAPNIYLNTKLIESKNLKLDDVAETLAVFLRKAEGIHSVYTSAQLKPSIVDTDDAITKRTKLAYADGRSGDVYVILKPYYLPTTSTTSTTGTGTTHGSPHSYDTHVPLLVYGPGIAGGTRKEAVTPLHAAPIASWFLGLQNPKDCLYSIPKTLEK